MQGEGGRKRVERESIARSLPALLGLPSGPTEGAGFPDSGGGGRKGTSKREHYLLEVFKFIAQMMFLISTTAIN